MNNVFPAIRLYEKKLIIVTLMIIINFFFIGYQIAETNACYLR